MKTALVSLVLTLAAAASLVVLVDRFQGAGAEDAKALKALTDRIAKLEAALTTQPDAAASPVRSTTSPEGLLPPGTKTLGDAIQRLEELQGLVLDAERGLRQDMTKMFEKLLIRLEDIQVAGGTAKDDPAAKEKLREKLKEMGVTIVDDEQMIEIKGEASETNRPIEFAGCVPGGRAFESLLLFDVVPSALKIAMEELGYVESDPDPTTWTWSESASGAYLYVLWDGLKKPRRIEDLILNRETEDCMARTKWMFTASRFFTDNRTFDRHFVADLHKGLIAVDFQYTSECILACPLPEAGNPNLWLPNPVTMPKPGTKVRLLIRKEAHAEWDKIS